VGFSSPDIALGRTPQKTLFLAAAVLQSDPAAVADRTENPVSSGTSIGDMVWHVPLLLDCLMCYCLAMAASSILHVTILKNFITLEIVEYCSFYLISFFACFVDIYYN
jgi:hypothetical protein